MERRSFLKRATGVSMGAVAATLAAPALASGPVAAVTTYGTGALPWVGWTTSAGQGYSYVYLYSGPTMDSGWVADVPVDQPVTVVGVTSGQMLDYPNVIWYRVATAYGSGWMYSGVVTDVPVTPLTADEVAPPPGPIPDPVGYGRSIGISLSRQHLWAYEGGAAVLDDPVTTGKPAKPTPTGLYHIQRKIPNFKFISPWPPGSPFWYPDSPTNYALQFRQDGYYIHDAPWRPYYGAGTNLPHLDPDGTVRAGSHGCVNTMLGTILFLAGWTPVGAPVLIIP